MKKQKKIILFFIGFAIGVFIVAFCTYAVHERKNNERIYNEAVILLEAGKADEAIDKFREMDNFIQYQGVQELLINYHIDTVCPYCGHDLK